MTDSVNGTVRQVYTDGGCVVRNPSPWGGSWAWVHADGAGHRLASRSGLITPEMAQLPAISNNLTELLAAVEGLEPLPDGWNGDVFTDSQITLHRIGRKKDRPKFNGVPPWLVERVLAVKERLGGYRVTLLGGHPTRQELQRGRRKDGMLVSVHNVHCDRLCREAAHDYLRQLRRQGVLT